MRKTVVLIGVMMLSIAAPAAAQSSAGQPGYYPIEELGIFASGEAEVDIDLNGAALQVAAGAMEDQQGDLADMIAGLERVRVQVGAPKNADASAIGRSLGQAVAALEASGWEKILQVVEDSEQVYLFSLEGQNSIVGLTVLVNDGGTEVVLVNIAGIIDPRALGRVISKLEDMPDLEAIMTAVEQ